MEIVVNTMQNVRSFMSNFFGEAGLKYEKLGIKAGQVVDEFEYSDENYRNFSGNNSRVIMDFDLKTLEEEKVTDIWRNCKKFYKSMYYMYMNTAIKYAPKKNKMELTLEFCAEYGIDDESQLGPPELYRCYHKYLQKLEEAENSEDQRITRDCIGEAGLLVRDTPNNPEIR